MTDTFFEVPADRIDRFVPCYERTPDNRFRRVDGTTDSRHASGVTCYSGAAACFPPWPTISSLPTCCVPAAGNILGRRTVEYMGTNHLPDDGDLASMGQPEFTETSYTGNRFRTGRLGDARPGGRRSHGIAGGVCLGRHGVDSVLGRSARGHGGGLHDPAHPVWMLSDPQGTEGSRQSGADSLNRSDYNCVNSGNPATRLEKQ